MVEIALEGLYRSNPLKQDLLEQNWCLVYLMIEVILMLVGEKKGSEEERREIAISERPSGPYAGLIRTLITELPFAATGDPYGLSLNIFLLQRPRWELIR